MVPEGMRAYTPGDPVSRINWKATARLDDVYVREFEIETIRPVAILFDGRHTPFRSTRENPNEYRRHVAAALVADAATHGDPVGLYHITEDGVKASQRLSASPEQYLQLREQLYTAADTSPDTTTGTKSSDQTFTPPGNTGRIGERLQQDQSAFGTKLTPFLTDTTSRVQRIDGDSLTETARTYLKRQQQDLRVAILTDDQRQAEVYETAKLAGQLSPEVLVFLTPTVLFEANDIAAIDDIYTRYAAFERYRKRLNQLENVTAYEITPGDKLQEVLDHEAIAKQ
jgi:uncharacterized protein (DUF58 family)